jgi:hypothetical protein
MRAVAIVATATSLVPAGRDWLDDTLLEKTPAMKSAGGKVCKLTGKGEASDLATMGGAEAVEKKMAETMKIGDSTIETPAADRRVVKPGDGATLAFKHPVAWQETGP